MLVVRWCKYRSINEGESVTFEGRVGSSPFLMNPLIISLYIIWGFQNSYDIEPLVSIVKLFNLVN